MTKKDFKETYISVDIEADGPIPGEYSMMSIGAAAFDEKGKLLDTFEINLKPLLGAKQDPDTMNWWKKWPEAYKHATENAQYPGKATREFVDWVNKQPGSPVFVGYPTGFDFTFVYWYMIKFCGFPSPFSFSALDIKTYAMAALKKPFRKATKNRMPAHWLRPYSKHTHKAIEDAIEQGEIFFKIRNDLIWWKCKECGTVNINNTCQECGRKICFSDIPMY